LSLLSIIKQEERTMAEGKPEYKPLAGEPHPQSGNINSVFSPRNPTGMPQIQTDRRTGEKTVRDPETGETLVVVEDTCPKCCTIL